MMNFPAFTQDAHSFEMWPKPLFIKALGCSLLDAGCSILVENQVSSIEYRGCFCKACYGLSDSLVTLFYQGQNLCFDSDSPEWFLKIYTIELCVTNGIQGGTLKPWPEFVEGLFGGALADKSCLFCKFLVSFVLQRPLKFLTKRKEPLLLESPGKLFSGKCVNRKPCGCGGIGRRAGFRCLWASARGGSTPLIRIKPTLIEQNAFFTPISHTQAAI